MTKKFGGALQQLQRAKAAAQVLDSERQEDEGSGSLEATNTGIREGVILENPEIGKTEIPEEGNTVIPEPGIELRRMEKYTTTLEKQLIRRLKMYALQNDLKHQDVVAAALEAYLESRE